ncbi:MAG: hypothetical protein HS116_09290 [Planctomycetes bacterium]|nr:hypothetical protein [Planctomycetota bacterium]
MLRESFVPSLCVIAWILSLSGCGNAKQTDVNEVGSESVDEDVWENGKPKSRQIFLKFASGESVRHGTQTEWFENGQKRLETQYANGKLDGPLTEWFMDGQKARAGAFRAGKETGTWTAWQPTGAKYWEAEYVEGRIQGKKTYWRDGKVSVEEMYDKVGELISVTQWHSSGAKEQFGTFRGGKKHGIWTVWNKDGSIQHQGEWKDGLPWEGECGVPLAGDAGSWAGLVKYERYHLGQRQPP